MLPIMKPLLLSTPGGTDFMVGLNKRNREAVWNRYIN
jgi:hypothetical protein